MGHKRKPSFHQKQILFLAIIFGALMIALVVALLWIFSRQPPGGAAPFDH